MPKRKYIKNTARWYFYYTYKIFLFFNDNYIVITLMNGKFGYRGIYKFLFINQLLVNKMGFNKK